jgi:hypothetical protein
MAQSAQRFLTALGIEAGRSAFVTDGSLSQALEGFVAEAQAPPGTRWVRRKAPEIQALETAVLDVRCALRRFVSLFAGPVTKLWR